MSRIGDAMHSAMDFANSRVKVEEQLPGYEQGGIFTFDTDKTLTAAAAAVQLLAALPADTLRSVDIQLHAKRSVAGNASTVTFVVKQSLDGGTTYVNLPFRKSDGTWVATLDIAPSTAGYLAAESQAIHVDATGGLISVWANCVTNNAVVSAKGGWIPG